MTFGLVSKSVSQAHYTVIFTNTGVGKETKRNMKSTSIVNLRANIIATGLLEKYPLALIYTAKGDFVGSVKRSKAGKTAQYTWQGRGDKPYRCLTDGSVVPVKKAVVKKAAKKPTAKSVPASKPVVLGKTGNKFLDDHIIVARLPRPKGRA